MGTDKAIAEFVVHQISRWTPYGKVAETVADVAKLAHALGLVDGVKGVDARVRLHLPQGALALEHTMVWNHAHDAAARICQHANIDWRDLVTDLNKVRAGLQPSIDQEARDFRSLGDAQHLANDDLTRPAPQLTFDEPKDKGLLNAFIDASLQVLQEEAIERKDFLQTAALEGLNDHERMEKSIAQTGATILGKWDEPAGRPATRYLAGVASLAINDPERAEERSKIEGFIAQRAEQIAATITNPDLRAEVLTALAEALAPTKPHRAEHTRNSQLHALVRSLMLGNWIPALSLLGSFDADAVSAGADAYVAAHAFSAN